MTKAQIIEALAKAGKVERMAKNISHSGKLSQDLEDLCQMVYLILLEKPEATIVSLWEDNELDFYIAKIVTIQMFSKRSDYNRILHDARKLDADINDLAESLDL